MTREEWLKRAVRTLRPLLRKADIEMRPRWQVSMSLTSANGAIGQFWYESSSENGQVTNILISPTLSDPVEVLDTLLHEMIHASLPVRTGHGPKFQKACRLIGMTKGSPKSAGAGPELRAELERVAAFLGEFNHTALVPSKTKRRGTKWPVYCSTHDERYRVQISVRALEEYGPPICPITREEMVPAEGRPPKW